MFRSKEDVDKHRQESFEKLKSEKEKNLRSLSIALLYYKVDDFESAKQYVSKYLSVKDDSSVGHKLLAQCYEALGEKQKALDEYKYSLQFDPKQDELVLKVCKLLAETGIIVDKTQASYWLEKGEVLCPYDATIHKLKQKITVLGDGKKVKMGSTDQSLEFYIKNGRLKEIYNETLGKTSPPCSLEFLERAIQIFEAYKTKFPNSIDEQFYANYLFVVERTVALYVQDVEIQNSNSIPECVSLLAKFDGILSAAASLKSNSQGLLPIINHMSGQLCYHTANILFRKIKWDENNTRDMSQLTAALLLLSSAEHFNISDSKIQDKILKPILSSCAALSTYRISQAGFLLLSLSKNSQEDFVQNIFRSWGMNCRKRVLEHVYSTSDFRNFIQSSFFKTSDVFSKLPDKLPEHLIDRIGYFVSITEITQPVSLLHLVWLGVQYLRVTGGKSISDMSLPAEFRTKCFQPLPFSQSNLSSSYIDSLSVLDVDAFLYACIYTKSVSLHVDSATPVSFQALPADVSKVLNSPEHDSWGECCEWWKCAYQKANQTMQQENLPAVRSVLQRGLEAIRSVECNSLPLPLLVLLGRTFANRAAAESTSKNAAALKARASYYWNAAVPQLTKIGRSEVDINFPKTMFGYMKLLVLPSDALQLLDEARSCIDVRQIKDGQSNVCNITVDQSPVQSSTSKYDTVIKKILQTVTDQDSKITRIMDTNTEIVDRLETLFNKQERLASTQLDVSQMVATLTKKINDFVLSNESCIESLSQVVQPLSPNVHQTAQFNATYDPMRTNTPVAGSNLNNYQYPMPANNVQTSFPMYQYNHTAAPLTTVPQYVPPVYPNIAQNVQPSEFPPYPPLQFSPFLNMDLQSLLNFSSANEVKLPAVVETHAPPPIPSNCSTVSTPRTSTICSTSVSFSPFSATTSGFTNTAAPRLSASGSCVVESTPVKSTSFFGSPNSFAGGSPHSFQIPVPDGSFEVKSPSVEVPEDCEDSDDERHVEHDPMPDFKPIIPLPDEITVTTGEEDEEILFESRVKLFRFVDKEWKERGLGAFKILKNLQTGRVRVLMRREVVHKVCANHLLTASMTLTQLASSDRAWVYSAPDFADEKMVIEKLCIKFKTPDIAKEFRRVFEQYKSANENLSPVKATSAFSARTPAASPAANVISSMETPKKIASPVSKQEENKAESTPETKTKFHGFTFTSKPIISQPAAKKEEKVEEKPKAPFSSFSFNMSSLSQPQGGSKLFPNASSSESSGAKAGDTAALPFASVGDTIDFSSLSKTATNTPAFAKSEKFKGFAGAGSLVFGGRSPANKEPSASPAISEILKGIDSKESKPNTSSPQSNVSQSECADEEFEPTAEFTPVIPLPSLVDVKTGEEGLKVLYEEHCKLFRYVNNEWKERGIGKLKILRDPKDSSVRMLMRRDQVHKVCCNQRLTASIDLQPLKTNNKAWTWSNQDFSEGEMRTELLCVRFKNVEQGTAFQQAFTNALNSLPASESNTSSPVGAAKKSSLPTLSQQFKRDPSSWECKMCYVVNKNTLAECSACGTPNEGSEGKKDEKKATSSLSALFKPKEGSWSCKACYVNNNKDVTNCVACATSKDGTAAPRPSIFGPNPPKFGTCSFGSPATDLSGKSTIKFGVNADPTNTQTFKFGVAEPSATVPVAGTPSLFSFGNVPPPATTSASSMFSFGVNVANEAAANTAAVTTTPTSNSPVFSFGSDSSLFTSAATNFSFGNPNQDQKSSSGGSMFGTLSKTETKPHEAVTPASQANAFAFGSQSSLFSGSGAVNTPEAAAQPTSAFSSFSFKLPDNQVTKTPVKFGFSNAVADKTLQNDYRSTSRGQSSSSDEVEFVSEIQVSAEDKKLAESLMLPQNYFTYKYVDRDCPGCVGCDPEDLQSKNNDCTKGKSSILAARLQENSCIKDNTTETPVDLASTANSSGFIFGAGNQSWLSNKESTGSSFNFGNIFNTTEKLNTTAASAEVADGGDNDEEVVPNENDPYFEPIIPLPDIVQTKTGEEEETVLFKQRSKLYRYDQDKKEWKERGVGDIKLLHHPSENTYRFLLRRDQVHKVVLNQRITPALNLEPMPSSKNSWCWFGMNLTEESAEPMVENLAIRFKTEEITNEFYNKVNECVSEMNASEAVEEANDSRLNESNSSGQQADSEERGYDDPYDYNVEEYDDGDEEDYVDEQGIEDAMHEYLEAGSEIVLEEEATLRFLEHGSEIEYTGFVQVVKHHLPETDTVLSYVNFSTPEVPSVYNAVIASNTVTALEGDTVIFRDINDEQIDGKVNLRFVDEVSASRFSDVFETMKSINTDADPVA